MQADGGNAVADMETSTDKPRMRKDDDGVAPSFHIGAAMPFPPQTIDGSAQPAAPCADPALELKRQELQKAFDALKTVEERRGRGQFSTPFMLARKIARHALALLGDGPISFLEPAAGTGAFYSALLQESQGRKITFAKGIEIDKEVAGASKSLCGSAGLDVLCGDFAKTLPDRKYNLVPTNPPYVPNHFISKDEKMRLGSLVEKEVGIHVSGLSGLY